MHCDILFTQEFNVRALFLSAQFWPPFKENPLKLPDIVMEHFETYTKAFETYKVSIRSSLHCARYDARSINFALLFDFQSNRTLSWKPFLGVANVEVELKDRTLNLSVSPVLATIIWHFQSKRKF
jgi:anaphase-promoting complex subunit 2